VCREVLPFGKDLGWAVRFSFSKDNTNEEIDAVIEKLKELI